MQTTRSVYLPTEILLIIADMLWNDETYDPGGMTLVERQKNFYSFCLVSRQWYSVGISYLYECPQLWQGNKFAQFANTVSPPLGTKKGLVDLASLVKILNLAYLVHQTSNSQTARLLSRVKKNLETFIAPQSGIGVNSLASISKCQNLVHLDLSLVPGGVIEFSRLKKTVSSLSELCCLYLPTRMELTLIDASAGNWPPKLSSMKVGGILDREIMLDFDWPANLRRLELKHCKDLDTPVLEGVLDNLQLREKLEVLILSNHNGKMFSDSGWESPILYGLERLIYLKIPLDFTEFLSLLPVPDGMEPLPLRTLELTHPYFSDDLSFDFPGELLNALTQNLRKLWALGVGESSLQYIQGAYKQIDDEIWKHVEASSDEELDKLAIEDLGIYIIDDDPIV